MTKYLIINADDFGASRGVNRGILACHTQGVVTSASLMVTGRAAHEAVTISRDCPGLSVGLHWDVWGEGERQFDLGDVPAVRREFCRQVEEFHRLLGRMPTHIDSHYHVHRRPEMRSPTDTSHDPSAFPRVISLPRDPFPVCAVGVMPSTHAGPSAR